MIKSPSHLFDFSKAISIARFDLGEQFLQDLPNLLVSFVSSTRVLNKKFQEVGLEQEFQEFSTKGEGGKAALRLMRQESNLSLLSFFGSENQIQSSHGVGL